jgi:hypothetical protein
MKDILLTVLAGALFCAFVPVVVALAMFFSGRIVKAEERRRQTAEAMK